MIKPVYFGDRKIDKKRLDYANKIDNFSEWVKNKIDEDIGVIKIRDNNVDIECLVRKIIKEEIKFVPKNESPVVIKEIANCIELNQDKIPILIQQEEVREEESLNTDGWTL